MFEGVFERSFYGNTIGTWLLAIGMVIAAAVVAKVLYWLFGTILRRVTNKTKTRIDDILLDMLEEPLIFAVVLVGLWFALGVLSLSEQLSTWVDRAFYILTIFNVAWLITRVFDALVTEYLAPLVGKTEGTLDDQLLPIIRKGIKAAVWIVATVVALNNAGYDVGAIIAGLGIGGLAFALAAQDTVANLFGGFTIFTDKPFGIGDRVKAAGFDGTVQEIGIRSTRLRTLEGRLVTIPNSAIASAPTENVSSEPNRKVVNNLGLTYDMDDGQVQLAIELVRDIAREDEGVEEGALAAFNAFGDFALNVLFIYYIKKDADILETLTRVNLEILRRFSAENLEFAFPSQTIYTKSLDAPAQIRSAG